MSLEISHSTCLLSLLSVSILEYKHLVYLIFYLYEILSTNQANVVSTFDYLSGNYTSVVSLGVQRTLHWKVINIAQYVEFYKIPYLMFILYQASRKNLVITVTGVLICFMD